MTKHTQEKNKKFRTWNDQDIADQFWYLTKALETVSNSVDCKKYTDERNEIVGEAVERKLIAVGYKMPPRRQL